MKRIFTFTIILMALTACAAPQLRHLNLLRRTCLRRVCQILPRSIASRMGTNSKFTLLPMAVNPEYVFFRMAAPVTSGPISGESVARHLPRPLRQPQKQVVVAQEEVVAQKNNASGGYMPPGTTEEIADWWGVIKSTEPGAQYDDYFERQDLGQIIYFGIDSMDPAVKSQIEALRDSGKIVHLYGTLLSNVPDYNGSQIQVDRIEVEEQDAGSFMPPGATEEIADWWGVIKSTEPGAQYDDYFERWTTGRLSTLASIQWTRRYSPRSRRCATAARSFISMAHYLAMCLITTARRSRWIASRLKSNDQSIILLGWEEADKSLRNQVFFFW